MGNAPGNLIPTTHLITQEQISEYAEASGDHNPLHLDEDFAAGTPYGRTVAHGMLVMAFVSEAMGKTFGKRWLSGGKLRVKFRAPVFPGDTITTNGTLKSESTSEIQTAEYSITVRKQDGTTVITGYAIVAI